MSFSIIDSQAYNQGKMGAIVELVIDCNELDLSSMAKSDLYVFVKEILFHIAAMSPKYLSKEDVPNSIIKKIENNIDDDFEKSYFMCNNHTEKAELHIKNQISKAFDFTIKWFYEAECLLSQPWVKDKSKTIQKLVEDKSLSIGYDIRIKRFERYEIKKEVFEKKAFAFDIPIYRGIPLKILKKKCPNCCSRLVYVAHGSSHEILCERPSCYSKFCRGI